MDFINVADVITYVWRVVIDEKTFIRITSKYVLRNKVFSFLIRYLLIEVIVCLICMRYKPASNFLVVGFSCVRR